MMILGGRSQHSSRSRQASKRRAANSSRPQSSYSSGSGYSSGSSGSVERAYQAAVDIYGTMPSQRARTAAVLPVEKSSTVALGSRGGGSHESASGGGKVLPRIHEEGSCQSGSPQFITATNENILYSHSYSGTSGNVRHREYREYDGRSRSPAPHSAQSTGSESRDAPPFTPPRSVDSYPSREESFGGGPPSATVRSDWSGSQSALSEGELEIFSQWRGEVSTSRVTGGEKDAIAREVKKLIHHFRLERKRLLAEKNLAQDDAQNAKEKLQQFVTEAENDKEDLREVQEQNRELEQRHKVLLKEFSEIKNVAEQKRIEFEGTLRSELMKREKLEGDAKSLEEMKESIEADLRSLKREFQQLLSQKDDEVGTLQRDCARQQREIKLLLEDKKCLEDQYDKLKADFKGVQNELSIARTALVRCESLSETEKMKMHYAKEVQEAEVKSLRSQLDEVTQERDLMLQRNHTLRDSDEKIKSLQVFHACRAFQ
uniref:Uncharacterized protein n=1 Tax=Palpitomonas bilix TaxID=652834 RepID=A0A7S3DDA3_9EUKA|mmetsp:Transcript_31787/g.82951  ORF Transcript_31787/g.82951 Transcript_31787/m.82951 type:complete len:487 (+) Transcript_31787:123-1583(+)